MLRVSSKVEHKIEEVRYLNGVIYTVTLLPSSRTYLKDVSVELDYLFNENSLVYCNGFQSWTDSREFSKNEKMRSAYKIPKILNNKYHFDKYGDSHFYEYKNKKGVFHSFSYGYVKSENEYDLIGSLNEQEVYTIIEYDFNTNKITIKADLDIEIEDEFVCLKFFMIKGNENKVFRTYKSLFDTIGKRSKFNGYVTWYNYYQNINEELIKKNISSLSETNYDIFQIDDGYCYFNGDYKNISFEKFPNGLKHLVDRIHNTGALAGIWIAPFICEVQSEVAKKHPDYLIKDENGLPLMVGSNWSGMYAFDLNKEEVRNYIVDFVKYFTDEIGFDFIKADFLYAAVFSKTNTITRAKSMYNAMKMLREACGDKLILGCGVPLFSALNLVDYCRIGCDVSLKFDDSWFMKFMHRERISTKNTILNTIYRRHLDGFGFYNDPDVYLLRDDNNKLTEDQKYSLAFINHLFGSIYLTSDMISDYNVKKQVLLNEMRRLTKATNKKVTRVNDDIAITFTLDGVDNQYIYHTKNGKLDKIR